MSRTRRENTTTPFSCTAEGKTVRIHQTWTVLLDSYGAEAARAPQKTSCDNQDNCLVATHRNNSTTYDWSKCPFVQSNKGA